ncbi:peptidylprolyl isomerase [Prevotella dentasini]|uniref:peptidylprolyl isomerase n=1 Tax=Prevotella dentasini TaxID=589537 RepID=UPI00046B0897|nr:peptidylprolyl isomerase [Prevotella dentasini]
MKLKALLAVALLSSTMAYAQNDPTIMTINGQPVSRSEFEYSYNKNNAEGVIDKKGVDEYVDLFVNYKLKVQAALDARLDTLSSFKNEFLTYRDQQIRPTMITEDDVEAEAQRIYRETQKRIDGNGGMFRCAHILLSVSQKASEQETEAAKNRADSVYNALMKGDSFAALARQYSGDKGSAIKGGELPLLTKGQTVPEFENALMALKPGEISKPVKSPFGYHIIKMIAKQNFMPYDSVKLDIWRFIEARGLREQIISNKLDTLAKLEGNGMTPEKLLDRKLAELEAKDPNLKNLVREYHDGLLLFEISNRVVWEKAAQDEAGLEAYFKKHKKDYKWSEPRFKGMAYHVKDAADVKAVRDCVARVPFKDWAETLRKAFNNDSIIRIRVEKGIFKPGDNALVDKQIFGKDTTVTPVKDYPIDAVYGEKLKAPKEMEDVRGLVTADYQESLEKAWVADLRKKYKVVVNRDVLATVNKH